MSPLAMAATHAMQDIDKLYDMMKAIFNSPQFKRMITELDGSLSQQEIAMKDVDDYLKQYEISFPEGVSIDLTKSSVIIKLEVPYRQSQEEMR